MVKCSASGYEGKWVCRLSPQRPSKSIQHTINITDQHSGQSKVLQDILFGDVWLCSGQSNMEFTLPVAFGGQEAIAHASIPGLRLLTVNKNHSHHGVLNNSISIDEGWVPSNPFTACGQKANSRHYYCEPHCAGYCKVPSYKRPTWGYTSAVCWWHAKYLLEHLDNDVPIGMLASSWGGTTIQSWSSAEANAECGVNQTGKNWESMMHPLLDFPIKGALWYQGEANTASPSLNNKYACQIKALIKDWRKKWINQADFPFISAQLAPWTHPIGLPSMRYAQLATLDLPNTGLTVGMDLADPDSPCHDVHIRNKTAVAHRMALWSLRLAYGNKHIKPPMAMPESINVTGGSVYVRYSRPVEFRSINQTTNSSRQSFYVIGVHKHQGRWISVQAVVKNGNWVVTDPIQLSSRQRIVAVSYGWNTIPKEELLYTVATTDNPSVPAFSWLALCDEDGVCTMPEPGKVPLKYGNEVPVPHHRDVDLADLFAQALGKREPTNLRHPVF
eukprot:TRINITY_DN68179_c7_g2_i1.p1 TRINITY_DN68179_c7_g2~~TRINITY_DN68179_c7_g2_i1.p1  ORF type:complete len:573 (+),score=32.62 TRINITY_DN68179_c7_g2_i1:219-1721(+)